MQKEAPQAAKTGVGLMQNLSRVRYKHQYSEDRTMETFNVDCLRQNMDGDRCETRQWLILSKFALSEAPRSFPDTPSTC